MQILIENLKRLVVIILMASSVLACQDEDAPVPVAQQVGADSTANLNLKVNSWISSMMKELYYWTEEIPEKTDPYQSPEDFFKNLLYAGDRFSVIVPNFQKLMNSLNGVNREAGYEFMLTRASGSDTDVVAVLLYVKENSPAAHAGLMRGDLITAINGSSLTMSNYSSLISNIYSDHTITYERFSDKAGDYEVQPQVSLEAVELAENPHYMDTVYALGGKKVGYYVYNFFAPGPNKGDYDTQMDQIIANFKNQGVSDIILDLRYNSGGAISSAANLGSLLGRGVDHSKVFYENRWNPAYQEYWESQAEGDDILRGKFQDKVANIGNNLSGKLYILVGSRTASASELIINGLKPYMDVYLIGEQTVGKNVGSIPVDDSENPDNHYGILPIVFQVFNSEGSSDYAEGFMPDAEVDELKYLPLKQLGDLEEPLLARAVADITGVNARTKREETARISVVEKLESSIDSKARTNRLIYDLPIK